MTEIREYRGKRVDTGKWVYGFYFRDIGSLIKEKPSSVSTPTHLVDPETVGQWSGETNFEGNKIYKGDYIETWDTIILIREVRGGGLAPFRQTKNGFTRMTNWDHAIHGKNHRDNPRQPRTERR